MEVFHLFSLRSVQIMFVSLGIYVLLLLLSEDAVTGDNEDLTEFSDTMCTNKYPVSHNRTRPDLKYYIDYDKVNATAKTCQDFCNNDTNCRSVLYQKNNFGRRYCQTYNISVQELKDTNKLHEIFLNYDTAQWLIFITYDRDCVKVYCSERLSTYLVSHNRSSPDVKYCINTIKNNTLTPQACQGFCDDDNNCRSVRYLINNKGERQCNTYTISVQELIDTENKMDIYTANNANSFPVFVTYDRACGTPTTTPTTTTPTTTTTTSSPAPTSSIPSTSTTQASRNNTDRPTTKPGNIFCPAGEGVYGNVCKPCKENEVSAYGIYPCIAAGEGEKPNHDKSKFICIAGYERNGTEDKCQKCQAGYFKSESGDTPPCFPCPPNTKATKQGATRCGFLYGKKLKERCTKSSLTSNEDSYDNGDGWYNISHNNNEYD